MDRVFARVAADGQGLPHAHQRTAGQTNVIFTTIGRNLRACVPTRTMF